MRFTPSIEHPLQCVSGHGRYVHIKQHGSRIKYMVGTAERPVINPQWPGTINSYKDYEVFRTTSGGPWQLARLHMYMKPKCCHWKRIEWLLQRYSPSCTLASASIWKEATQDRQRRHY